MTRDWWGLVIFPHRTQCMMENTMPIIQTLWPSGKCLKTWPKRKRRSFTVSGNLLLLIFGQSRGQDSARWPPAVQLIGFLIRPVSFPPVFVTGLDRIPCTGMKGVRMTVSVLSGVSDLGMPQSHTCLFLLQLPIYQQNPAETMRSKLLQAINHKRGFQTEDAAGSR